MRREGGKAICIFEVVPRVKRVVRRDACLLLPSIVITFIWDQIADRQKKCQDKFFC